LFAVFLHVPPLQLQTMQHNSIYSHHFPSLLITVVSGAVDVGDESQGEVVFAVLNVVWNSHLRVGCERLSCSLGFVGVLL
jgi:hypothetical protein